MPTYEYECKICGYSFDVFQNMSDEPLKNCPQCGKELRRVINGGTGVIFKGSGFYVTDKKGGKGDSHTAKPPSPALAAEASAKTESVSPAPQQNSSPVKETGASEKKAAG